MSFPFGEENYSGYLFPPVLSGTLTTSSGLIVIGSDIFQSGFTLASGSVNPFLVTSGMIGPLTIASGSVSSGYGQKCIKCGLQLGENRVTVMGVSGLYLVQCYSCVGYSFKKGFGYHHKAEWIEASISGMFYQEEHKGIIVDWLDENQRPGDAAFLREYYNLEIK